MVFKPIDGDQVQVLDPLAFNTTLVPAHILPEVTDIVGFGTALTVKVAVFEHVPTVPVTVTVPTAAPLLDVPIITGPFKVLGIKPLIGPQVQVLAPLAVRVTLLGEPLKLFIHNVGLLEVIFTTGKFITVTVTEAKLVHVAWEPKILYVVVIVGLAMVLAKLEELNPMLGVQV